MTTPAIDQDYLLTLMQDLLRIPSPTGYLDGMVARVCDELDALGTQYELTQRRAIRAKLRGAASMGARALVCHLDTTGALVKQLKSNGRLELVPIGTWSSRFAEGARVTILSEGTQYRGTVLPLKASGHTYNTEIDTQEVSWQHVEVRVDEKCHSAEDLRALNIQLGDFVAFDSGFERHTNGYINSRYLDNKAGTACILAAARALQHGKFHLPVDCHLLFTISEEVGSGAAAVVPRDTAEMVAIDNATQAPGQNSSEYGVTVAMADSSGPFDYHLTRKLIGLCESYSIDYARDVFRYYRSDAASAIEAGHDIRAALVCFGIDASHGYERTHADSLSAVAQLLATYVLSPVTAGPAQP
ncbi:MAG: osmoprotectant NAGGN system M42 family peptidase [Myxococcota bacterium]